MEYVIEQLWDQIQPKFVKYVQETETCQMQTSDQRDTDPDKSLPILYNRRPVSSVVERRTVVREVSGSTPRPDQHSGEENVLPL